MNIETIAFTFISPFLCSGH